MVSGSSRERMLAALDCGEPDRVPCSFMIYGALLSRSPSYAEFVERQLEMGLDAFVQLPPRPPTVVSDHHNLHGMPVRHDSGVEVREWSEETEGENHPILVKEYRTGAGTLRTEVRQTSDWPWGDHVPFLDDHLIPRSRKFLVRGPEDLDAFRYLLVPPGPQELQEFAAEAQGMRALASERDLLVAGGWGVGADLIGWVVGLENMVYAAHDQPDFMEELLEIIARWNRARMDAVLRAGVDLYIKRAWYESCDFWTPAAFHRFLLPILRTEAERAHESGAKFGYIITSRAMPLLDLIAESGVDVIIGVDPKSWDLEQTKKRLGGKVCLWGGVNGHLTVERGTPQDVQAEVGRALETLGPEGFILSPVDNIREDTPTARRNTEVLIDAWRRGWKRE